jgi:hypothetical protein
MRQTDLPASVRRRRAPLPAEATIEGKATLHTTGKVMRAQRKNLRVQVSFRIGPELRELLVAQTLKNGRSLAQEIEDRLHASFEQPALLDRVIGMLHEQREFLRNKFPDEATQEAA